MPLDKREGGLWFREELYPDVVQEFRVKKVLYEKMSRGKGGKKLHQLMVLDTPRFGRVFVLDGVVQTTEEDEAYYHEPLVHCAAFSHPRPKRALLIGCDGGTLREIRKHPLRCIDVVDIDKSVIEIMLKFMPSVPQDSFDDPRVRLTIDDGAEFVKRAKKKGKRYDLVIVDSPDPIGPARSLFQTSFYLDIAKILNPEGIVIRQTGSSALQPDEMPSNYRQMLEIFPEVQGFITAVPTYIGGYFTFVAASHKKGIFREALRTLDQRLRDFLLETLRWYSAEMHKAAMILPPDMMRAIEKSEYGIELIVDLYGCEYEAIASSERLKEFARELCAVIGMKPFGESLVPDFGHALSKTAGPSLVQLIESSAITAHYSPHWRMVCMNIFTCRTFDSQKTLEFVKGFFKAEKAVAYLLRRGFRVLPHRPELIVIE